LYFVAANRKRLSLPKALAAPFPLAFVGAAVAANGVLTIASAPHVTYVITKCNLGGLEHAP
jgi:hypothetical protein